MSKPGVYWRFNVSKFLCSKQRQSKNTIFSNYKYIRSGKTTKISMDLPNFRKLFLRTSKL